jgi:hypothetical protein
MRPHRPTTLPLRPSTAAPARLPRRQRAAPHVAAYQFERRAAPRLEPLDDRTLPSSTSPTVSVFNDSVVSETHLIRVIGPIADGTPQSTADSFTDRASDGQANAGPATVTVVARAAVRPPVAINDTYGDQQAEALTIAAAEGVLANDSDGLSAHPTMALLVSGPRHGTLKFNADGSFSYSPNVGFSGTDSFVYRASRGTLTSNEATVTIRVTATTASGGPTSAPPDHPPAPDIPPPVITVPSSGTPTSPPTGTVLTGGGHAPPIISTGSGGGGGGEAEDGSAAAAPSAPRPAAAAPAVPAARPSGTPTGQAAQWSAAPVASRPDSRQADVATAPSRRAYSVESLSVSLDRLTRDVVFGRPRKFTYADIALSAGAVAGVGYILLNTRLIAWLLSVVLAKPLMWRQFDPLQVLYFWERENGRRGLTADEEESLASLVGGVR